VVVVPLTVRGYGRGFLNVMSGRALVPERGVVLPPVSCGSIDYSVISRANTIVGLVDPEDGSILSKPGFEFRDALAFGVEFTLLALYLCGQPAGVLDRPGVDRWRLPGLIRPRVGRGAGLVG
jgi:hypothetical protein